MKKILELIKWFLYITPCIVFIFAINVVIAKDTFLPASILWQILLSGFLTAFVTVLLFPMKGTRLPAPVGFLLHYLALSAVMIGCGCSFGWMEFSADGIVMMFVSVAIVYLLTYGAYYLIDRKQADEINQKLKEKYGDK